MEHTADWLYLEPKTQELKRFNVCKAQSKWHWQENEGKYLVSKNKKGGMTRCFPFLCNHPLALEVRSLPAGSTVGPGTLLNIPLEMGPTDRGVPMGYNWHTTICHCSSSDEQGHYKTQLPFTNDSREMAVSNIYKDIFVNDTICHTRSASRRSSRRSSFRSSFRSPTEHRIPKV